MRRRSTLTASALHLAVMAACNGASRTHAQGDSGGADSQSATSSGTPTLGQSAEAGLDAESGGMGTAGGPLCGTQACAAGDVCCIAGTNAWSCVPAAACMGAKYQCTGSDDCSGGLSCCEIADFRAVSGSICQTTCPSGRQLCRRSSDCPMAGSCIRGCDGLGHCVAANSLGAADAAGVNDAETGGSGPVCGARACAEGGVCCVTAMSTAACTTASDCAGVRYFCTGARDCPGEACCVKGYTPGGAYSVGCTSNCPASQLVCASTPDCPPGFLCVPSCDGITGNCVESADAASE
jgi:hypothetical protein